MNAYCVILSRQPFVNPAYPRTKRYYVGAPTADSAIVAAADDNPHFRVMGVEHSDVYLPPPLNEPTPAISPVWQAA